MEFLLCIWCPYLEQCV